ncbi:MAG: EamA family transporter RarD [Ilumatobacteraceae bacterium]
MTPPDPDRHRAGIITGVAAYVLWGLLTVYWKLLSDFRAFELIGWRISTAAVVMALVLTVQRRWNSIRTVIDNRRLLGVVAFAAVLLTVNWTSYVWAVVDGHVLETALGYFIAPLGTVAVGVVVLGERLRTVQWIAIGFAVSSVVVLTVSYGAVPWLALVIAASWIVYGYLKKRLAMAPVDGLAVETFLLAAPAIVLAMALSGDATSVVSSASGVELALVVCTGFATVAPLLLFAHSSQRVPLTVIGPMQYIVPSMNFLLGWLVYGEELPASRFVGFALVWAGLALLTADTARRALGARAARAA